MRDEVLGWPLGLRRRDKVEVEGEEEGSGEKTKWSGV